MRKTLSVAELKRHLSEVLGDVAHGKHTVLVTRRGRPVARLLPVEQGPSRLADVTGWLEDDDPFFQFVKEAIHNRGARTPRSWENRGTARSSR
jgi:prevent-host-death family protein